ncbi:MAG TPA: HNH endonuclease [Bryobacteraceae bacterium]|jgi:hypothetical protein
MQCHEVETELWRPIPGYKPYWASSLGRIKNGNTERVKRPQPITSRFSRTKYQQVTLSFGSKRDKITKSVHRLVALTFLGPSDLPINHRDADKRNNAISNIHYCTPSENVQHAVKMGLMQNRWRGKLSDDDVREIRRMRRDGLPIEEIMERFQINRPHAYSIAAGRRYGRVKEILVNEFGGS